MGSLQVNSGAVSGTRCRQLLRGWAKWTLMIMRMWNSLPAISVLWLTLLWCSYIFWCKWICRSWSVQPHCRQWYCCPTTWPSRAALDKPCNRAAATMTGNWGWPLCSRLTACVARGFLASLDIKKLGTFELWILIYLQINIPEKGDSATHQTCKDATCIVSKVQFWTLKWSNLTQSQSQSKTRRWSQAAAGDDSRICYIDCPSSKPLPISQITTPILRLFRLHQS